MPLINTHTQVVGYGAAALGIPIAADRIRCLPALVRAGIVFLERTRRQGFASLNYQIESNSPASDFLVSIRPDGIFGGVLGSDIGRELVNAGTRLIKLPSIYKLLQELSAVWLDYLGSAAPNSCVLFEHEVHHVRQDKDGFYTSVDSTGRPLVRSSNLVLAVGACEQPESHASVLASEQVVRGHEDRVLGAALATGAPILIKGGSHSAFSVIDYLVRNFAGELAPGQLVVCHKHPIKQYYKSTGEAAADGVDTKAAPIDTQSGEVNRFDGLRGVARELYRQVRAGRQPLVRLLPLEELDPGLLAEVALTISACGYAARKVPIHDSQGQPIELAGERGNVVLTSDSRVIDATGQVMPSVFGMGLGYALPSSSGPKVGINHFHGEAGENVVRGTLAKFTQTTTKAYRSGAAGWTPPLADRGTGVVS